MQQMPWSTSLIKQCEQQIGQAMLSDEHLLVSFCEDFGKLTCAKPNAVCAPRNIESLQSLLQYANQHCLSVVIRGKGYSQGGQSLPLEGGLTIHLEHFTQVFAPEGQSIWVEANATWRDLLAVSLESSQAPFVLPYNCDLTVGGVISVGGVGAASFKYGSVVSNVQALEVVTANGEKQVVDASSALFQACLAGQGRFGLISKACIKLRPSKKMVRTFFLVYTEKELWQRDLYVAKKYADGIEAFCTPAIQGAKLTVQGRMPFAQWLYAMHVAIEYEEDAPELPAVLKPWKIHQQDESIVSYYHRHDSRFAAMKMTGQWDLQHLWYECFLPAAILFDDLEDILSNLPLHYANILQVVPLADNAASGFFMLPKEKDICALMILNPGILPAFLPGCIAVAEALDQRFLPAGGKRYLSGFLGKAINADYWEKHFDDHYSKWLALKKKYDPNQIFRSFLHAE